MSTRRFSMVSQVIAILFMFTLLLPGVQVLADPCESLAVYCPPDAPGTPDTSITVTPVCPEDPTKKIWIFRNWSDTEIEIGWSVAGGDSGTLIIPGKEAGEDYYETVLYTDAVEGTNVLDYYDGHSLKGSAESVDCPDSLTVVPVCTDVPDKKKWIVRNTNDVDISVTWSVYGTDQQGMLNVPGQEGDEPYGETVFYTDEVEGTNTVIVTGDGETHTAESSDEECIPPPEPRIDIVPVCTDVPGKNKWIIRNYHNVSITVNWSVNGDSQTGTLELDGTEGDEAYSETVLYTDATEEINTLIVSSDVEEYFAESSDEECLPPPTDIDIVPVCTDVEGKNKWIIRHYQDVNVSVTWSVYGDSQSGTIELNGTEDDEEYSETVLYTDATDEISTITVELDGAEYVAESSDEECLPPPPSRSRGSSSGGRTTETTTTDDDADIPDTESDQPADDGDTSDDQEILIEDQLDDGESDEDTSTQPGDDPEPTVEEEHTELLITDHIVGEELPNTATSWYNILIISLLTLIGSGYVLWRQRSAS